MGQGLRERVAGMDLQRDIWDSSGSYFITFLFIPGGRDDESVAMWFQYYSHNTAAVFSSAK